MDKKKYLEQIDKFYKNKFKRTEILDLGKTPDSLCRLGAEKLPLKMSQSNLRKSIREPKGSRSAHQVSRDIIERLPDALKMPVLVIDKLDKEGLLVLSDMVDLENRGVVIAIHLGKEKAGQKINEVKSIYGRTRLSEFLEREKENIVYYDNKKARHLLRDVEKQYFQPPISSSHENNIANRTSDVNSKKEKNTYAKSAGEIKKSDIVKDLKANGFQPTKSLVRNIRELNHLCGKGVSMKEIHDLYKHPDMLEGEAAKEAVNQIAAECRAQEMERLQIPPPEL